MAEDQVPRGDENPAGIEDIDPRHEFNTPQWFALAAVFAGAVIGTFKIANTSVGWHLASGRWILDHRAFLRSDPFSFTSGGAPWLDHEWLFQVGAALIHELGGAPALVFARALAIAALTLLLLTISRRSGLSAASALVLAVLVVVGARPRFFLRPELVTLLVVPAIVWLFLQRNEYSSKKWLLWLAVLTVIGANAHGGVLVTPILIGGIFAAEMTQTILAKGWRRTSFLSGLAGLSTVCLAILVNPYGWKLYGAPIKLAHLVDQAYIPNPEWISPSFSQAPEMYLALLAAALVMGLKERRASRWLLLIMASALAIRHYRNLGLFFVLLPVAVAPALASWRAFRESAGAADPERRRVNLLAVVAMLALAAAVAASPQPRFGFGFTEGYFPVEACDFLDREGLPPDELYNDVVFGGYLIDRYAPSRLVFQDDRNEIHEELLKEIWEIFQRSDVRAWSNLLSRNGAGTALVRYHPPLEVTTPEGRPLGERGFSALWFPRRDWALVYWDDVAMVFVSRESAPADLLENHEYELIHPDDMSHVAQQLANDPTLIAKAAAEVARSLRAAPESARAKKIANFLAGLPRLPAPVPVAEMQGQRQITADSGSDR